MTIQWVGTVFAVLAAGFWFWSAAIRLPKEITTGFGGVGGSMQTLGDKLRLQSRLSATAAVFAALAALAQAVYQVMN
jgi:hypothetical protein